MKKLSIIIGLCAFIGDVCVAGGINDRNRVVSYDFLDNSGTRTRISTKYCDGLGRERLSVIGTNVNGYDSLVMRTDYDRRGNVWRQWLAVPGGKNLLDTIAFEAAARAFYGDDEIPYTKYVYEESAMNRLEKEFGPGKLWDELGTTNSWDSNKQTGDLSCSLIRVNSDGSITVNGMYAPGTLRVTTVTDADGKEVKSFENRSGKVVMSRSIGKDGLVADTRFVYDVRGDLRYVISPEGSAQLPSSGNVPASLMESYAQMFEYDIHHRCISSRVPGCGAIEYVYDLFGRPILVSDAEQRIGGVWTLTKYDSNNRQAIRGEVTLPGATRASLQSTYGDSLLVENYVPNLNRIESNLGYTDTSGPRGFRPYMSWFYDDYDFIIGSNASEKSQYDTSTADGYTPHGLCTGTAMRPDITGECYLTATKYDHRGLVTRTTFWDLWLQDTRVTTVSTYDFVGNETHRTEKAEIVNEGIAMTTHTAHTDKTYDAYGRLLTESVSVDGADPVIVSDLVYDGVGRLTANNAGLPVQYGYDVRSNLTSIISDRFHQLAWYGNTPEAGAPVSYTGINALTSIWNDESDGNGMYEHTETFAYDGLGRLRSSTTGTGGLVSEELDVDLDANVVGIVRRYNGDIVQDAVMTMDGGKVVGVNDVSTPYWADAVGRFGAGTYALSYDLNGRLTSDMTRSVTSVIYYGYLNLPKRITMASGDYTHNTYMPDGRLHKRIYNTRTIQTTIKVNAQGDTIRSERKRDVSTTQCYYGSFEKDSKGWRYRTSAGHYDLMTGKHLWYLRDRLGSTVAVVDDNAHFVQTTGYYPSGTPYRLPNMSLATAVDNATDRLHIGNEWIGHSGLNWYDNTARMHDPVLMRFTSPDHLYADYPSTSPWSHCAANPINAIDPTGCAEIFMSNDGILQWIGSDGKDDGQFALVDKHLAKEIQKLTKQNQFYQGEISNSEHMSIIPSFEDLVFACMAKETSNVLEVEIGASKDAHGFIHLWDNGTEISSEMEGGRLRYRHSISPFIQLKHPIAYPQFSQWDFHIHSIVSSIPEFGSSYPSSGDKKFNKMMRERYGYNGTTFILGGKDNNITFHYGNSVIGTLNSNNLLGVLLRYKIQNSTSQPIY